MVAARDIKAGETVMEDMPLTYGPMTSVGVQPLCLGCYTCLPRDAGSRVTCQQCGWPMCSTNCCNKAQHRDQECQLFQDKGFRVDASKFNYSEIEPAYSCISPLRALILQKSDPERSEVKNYEKI